MAWLYLIVAGLFEIAWAVGLKYTDGFTKRVPTLLTLAAMTASITLLGLALRHIPVGTGYAVWTGIGAVGTAIFGIVKLGEPATAPRSRAWRSSASASSVLSFQLQRPRRPTRPSRTTPRRRPRSDPPRASHIALNACDAAAVKCRHVLPRSTRRLHPCPVLQASLRLLRLRRHRRPRRPRRAVSRRAGNAS